MKKLLLITAYCLLFTGCASIVGSTEQAVSVSSTPDKAKIAVTNKAGEEVYKGLTPANITLKKSDGYFSGEKYTINYSKEGYVPQSNILDTSVDNWYWLNAGIGGFIGLLLVDPATGAMWDLPNETKGVLPKNKQALH